MKVMVIVKATPESEAGILPSEQLLREMGEYNRALVEAGIMLAGEGLHPSSQGARVRFSGAARTVTRGPFAETHELIAGFWLWQVGSMDEAIEWVKRCPNPMLRDSEIELRRVYASEDFAPIDPTGELRAAEDRLRAQAAQYQLVDPRFESLPEWTVAGLQATFTPETRTGIPALWARFVPFLGQVAGQVGDTSYGVSHNFRDGCQFDYLAGVAVAYSDQLPAGFEAVRIPAGRYAVFTHLGHVSTIAQTIDAIWTKWLPNSGLKPSHAPCVERYTADFNPTTGLGGMEILVAME